jgi:hypothetical protein
MTLTLPGPTSNGTAFWTGAFGPPPVYTGDSFALAIQGIPTLTPAFAGNTFVDCRELLHVICDFDISWSATAGQLGSIAINIETGHLDVGMPFNQTFGLQGGGITTDSLNSGCNDAACLITGFWQSDLPMPEPNSLAILATAFLGLLALRKRYGLYF